MRLAAPSQGTAAPGAQTDPVRGANRVAALWGEAALWGQATLWGEAARELEAVGR